MKAIVKAIGLSTRFIYIEDQFAMYVAEVFEALAKTLERGLQQLVVVYNLNSPVSTAGCTESQRDLLQPLIDAYPDKVHVFVRRDETYIHAKMVLVDDIWVSIGSANFGRRSFTSDAEIGVAIVDGETAISADSVSVAKFAWDVRVRAWGEVSGIAVEEIRRSEVAEAIAMMERPTSKLRRIIEMPKLAPLDPRGTTTCELSDTDGRCPGGA